MSTRVIALLSSTLSLFLGGCQPMSSISGCDPDSEDFTHARELTGEQVTTFAQRWGVEDPAMISCDQLCRSSYNDQRGWEATTVEASCEMQLETDMSGAVTSATISCAGEGIEYYCEGRRPLGHVELVADARAGTIALADHLVTCAHLEQASVVAFSELAALLTSWGAPARLAARCQAAAVEESRHAARISELARRAGATNEPPAPTQTPAPRSLEDVARHNATEGCVWETWAALRASWTAARAEDPALRAAYAEIAAEEAGHAQLAWDLHAWLIDQLTP
ncbi:MAG: ferritin-like domain-containing protein, partial [Myxococcales bacterium]|nr:ferritin-like domain-containing protein [Myxococcales bacterium]